MAINPKCLGRLDFLSTFFGGYKGLCATLLSPILLFLILRLRRWRKRRLGRPRGRWMFPREELPYHVMRIYLLGNNSPKMPWALPEMDFDQLPELEDALQKPFKPFG